jgi:hypothetical protein
MRTGKEKADRRKAQEVMRACPKEVRIEAYSRVIREGHNRDRDEVGGPVYALTVLRDDRLFKEVVSLAVDNAAPVSSRIVAFMALSAIKNPQKDPRFEGFSAGLDEKGHPKDVCHTVSSSGIAFQEGSVPLSPDALTRISELKTRVFNDTTEPIEIRSAAACL